MQIGTDDIALSPLPIAREAPLSALGSRSLAVDLIIRGGSLAALGVATFFAGTMVPLSLASYAGFVVGGMVLFGWGALKAGRAARHLMRFGKAGSSTALVATTGLGVSVTTYAVTHLLLVLGIEPVTRALNNLSMIGAVGFATLLLALTAYTLIRLVATPDAD